MEWQPIETAPKDGSTVIVGADCYPVEPRTAKWVSDPYASACAPGWFVKTDGNTMLGDKIPLSPLYYEPTIWMPLPEPPKHK